MAVPNRVSGNDLYLFGNEQARFLYSPTVLGGTTAGRSYRHNPNLENGMENINYETSWRGGRVMAGVLRSRYVRQPNLIENRPPKVGLRAFLADFDKRLRAIQPYLGGK